MPKRRGNNEGSIMKRPSGTWRAMISLDGKRLSYSNKTRKLCQEWLKKMQAQVDGGLSFAGTQMQLGTYMEMWMQNIQENRRPKTVIGYRAIANNYVLPAFGNTRLNELQPVKIERFLTIKQQEGVGDRTCQLIFALLHVVLKSAVRKGLIGRNPMDAVEKPKVRNPKQKITLSSKEVQQFLITADGDRNAALYHLAISSGMREGELLGLKWSDIDWNQNHLKVERQIQRIPKEGLVFAPPKTQSGLRTIALGTMTMEKLREHKQEQKLECEEAGERWVENDLVFCTTIGTPSDPHNLLKKFKRMLETAGLPVMCFHNLRHTSITLALNEIGVPIKEAQHRAGHASPSTTINIYGGNVTTSLDERTAQELDNLITPLKLDLQRKHTEDTAIQK